jgi:hypothetical protein
MATTSRADLIKTENPSEYPFFYASHLPVAYYVAVAYLVLATVLVKRQSSKIILVLLLATLVEMTPVVMMENPWIPDQYPFMTEPTLLAENHHLSDFHYLDTTPGLAMTFSGALLASNAPPLILWQLAPLFGVLATLLIILIGRKMGVNGAICGLLFLAFNIWFQTNIFHRQTYSFVLFLLMVLVLLNILEKRRFKYSVLYIILLLAITITHPGTPAFLIVSLTIATFGFKLLEKNPKLLFLTLLSIVVFIAYDMYVSAGDFRRMVIFPINAMSEMIFGGLDQPAGLGYLSGYTSSFQILMNTRVFIALAYIGTATVVALLLIIRKKGSKSKFIALMHFGFLATFMTFMFGGAIYRMRPLLFLIPTSAILLGMIPALKTESVKTKVGLPESLRKRVNLFLRSRSFRQSSKIGAVVCLVVLFMIAPVLRYSGIPFLHASTNELSAKLFLDRYYPYDSPIYATEKNLPYGYSMLVLSHEPLGEPIVVLVPEENPSLERNYFTMFRFTTRDSYFVDVTSFETYVETLLRSLPDSHNLVYSSDRYHNVFLEVPKS